MLRDAQVACDLLDRLAVNRVLTPYSTDRLHNQHPPPPASCQSRQPNKSKIGGSILDADPPPHGVIFPRRITLHRKKDRTFNALDLRPWPFSCAPDSQHRPGFFDQHCASKDYNGCDYANGFERMRITLLEEPLRPFDRAKDPENELDH